MKIINKLSLFGLLLLTALSFSAKAQTLQLGTGTATTGYFPNYYLYNYSYSQTIYTAAELVASGAAGIPSTVTKIRFKPTAAVSTANWKNWTVYMGSTSQAGFATSTSWLPTSGMTTVFSGDLPIANTVANTWMELTLTTPFAWNGTSNIVIAIDENTPTWGSSPNWAGYTLAPASGNKGIYFYSDNTNPDPTAPPTVLASGDYGGAVDLVAQIQFDGSFAPACTGTPSAGTVPATAAVCGGSPYTLVATGSTTGVSGLSGQWQFRTPAGSGTWTNLAGATTPTYVVSAMPSTPSDYRYTLTCGTNTGNSNTLTTTINSASSCYCVPAGTNASYYLDSFSTSLGSTNIANNASGYSVAGYGNFTAQTVTQNQGSNVGFYGRGGGTNTYGIKIWVDWNQDGTFDNTTEVVYASTGYGNSQTGNFAVPAAAPVGSTRMRVGWSYSPGTGPADPCLTNLSGEYEDYTFVVTAPSCAVPSALVSSGVTATTATVSWTAASPAPAAGYEYYQSTTNTAPTAATVATGAVAAGIVTKNLTVLTPATQYYVWVRSACSASNKSTWTLSTTFTTLCVPYTAPFAESFNNGVLPNCWASTTDVGQTSANAFWKFGTGVNYGPTTNGRAAGTYAWVDASTPNLLIHTVTLTSPSINLTGLTTGYVEFDWFKNNQQVATAPLSNNKLTVQVNSGTGWTSIWSDTSNAAVWRTIGVPLAASYANATIQVRFVVDKDVNGVGDFYDDLLLDSFKVKEAPLTCSGTPSAGTVPATMGVCPGQALNLVATGYSTGVLGLSGQWQYRTPAGSGAWVNLVGATMPTYTVGAAPSTATDYRYTVTCGTNTGNSNTLTTTINPATQCYCTPIYTTACSGGDNIKDVILLGDVLPGINNLNTPCPTSGYQNYSATMSATLAAGGTYSGNVTTGYSSPDENVRIWIDYNQNGNFEATETVDTLQNISSTSTGAISFTVPAATTPGTYRMRVRLAYFTDPNLIDPCTSITYGEAHDYGIIITAGTTPCTPPVVNLGADTTICAGQTLTLNAGAANATYTKLWSNAATTQTIAVTTAGTYSVTVTNGLCSKSDTIVVGVTALPVVNLGADTAICAGSTLTLSAGAANSTFTKLWSNLATTQTIPVTTAGTYSVKVTNGACSKSDTVVVTVTALPVVNLGADTAICAGTTLTLDAGNAGATYAWTGGTTAQTLAVTTAGTYGVTVTNNGCMAMDSIAVGVTALPTVGGITATGTSPNFSFTANGATNVTTYAWTFGDGATSANTAPTHDYVQTTVDQTFTVTLIVSNECGSDTVTTTVSVPKSTGVNTLQLNAKELKLYPNPAQQLVTVENESKLTMKQIRITNILGQEVARIAVSNQTKQTINVANLAAGLYNVTIEFEEGSVNRKLEILK